MPRLRANAYILSHLRYRYAPVAQLDRASASGAEGRGFESRLAHRSRTDGPSDRRTVKRLTVRLSDCPTAAPPAPAVLAGPERAAAGAGRRPRARLGERPPAPAASPPR